MGTRWYPFKTFAIAWDRQHLAYLYRRDETTLGRTFSPSSFKKYASCFWSSWGSWSTWWRRSCPFCTQRNQTENAHVFCAWLHIGKDHEHNGCFRTALPSIRLRTDDWASPGSRHDGLLYWGIRLFIIYKKIFTSFTSPQKIIMTLLYLVLFCVITHQIHYRNDTSREPYLLTHPCTMETYMEITKHLIPFNWKKECKLERFSAGPTTPGFFTDKNQQPDEDNDDDQIDNSSGRTGSVLKRSGSVTNPEIHSHEKASCYPSSSRMWLSI